MTRRSNSKGFSILAVLFLLSAVFSFSVRATVLAPFKLSLQVQNGNATISWPAGITTGQVQIQSAPAVTGPWQNVGSPTTASSITTRTTGPIGFYRGLIVNGTITAPGPWVKRFGGSGNDSGCAVAVDAAGNIVVAGFFQGSVDFGGGILTSAGGSDIFIAKYSPTGAHIWSKRYGGVGDEAVRCIALDSSGNIFIGGYYTGVGNFGGLDLISAPLNIGDAFLAKYSSTGAQLWSVGFGGPYSDQINSVAVDSQGNAIVTGFFQGTVVIAGVTLYDNGQADTFLAKFSPSGQGLWSKNFPPNGGFDQGNGVAVDGSDNIYLTGTLGNYINLGGETFSTPGGYLAKFNSSGTHIWSRSIGTNTAARIGGLAVDVNGDVAVCGSFYHQTDLGAGTISGNSAGFDMFLAKYSGLNGAYRWAWASSGGIEAGASAVTVDAQNNLIVIGVFRGSYTMGAQTVNNQSMYYDGFVTKFNSSGSPQWIQAFGGPNDDGANGVAVDSSGAPVVTGAFSGTATVSGQSLTSAGGTDVLLMKLNP